MPRAPWHPFSCAIDAVLLPEATAHAPVLVVHAWAEWNGADRSMAALLKSLSGEYQDRIEFRSMDVDDEENFEHLTGLGIMQVPVLISHVRSRPVQFLAGLRPAGELRRFLALQAADWAARIPSPPS